MLLLGKNVIVYNRVAHDSNDIKIVGRFIDIKENGTAVVQDHSD